MDVRLQPCLARHLASRCACSDQRTQSRTDNPGKAGSGLGETRLAVDRGGWRRILGPGLANVAPADPIERAWRRIRRRLRSFVAQAEHRLLLPALDALREAHEYTCRTLRSSVAYRVRIVEAGHQRPQGLHDSTVGRGFRQWLAEIDRRQRGQRVGRYLAVDLALESSLDVGDLDGGAPCIDGAASCQMQSRRRRHVMNELLQPHGVAYAGQRQVGDEQDVGRSLDDLTLDHWVAAGNVGDDPAEAPVHRAQEVAGRVRTRLEATGWRFFRADGEEEIILL